MMSNMYKIEVKVEWKPDEQVGVDLCNYIVNE